MKTIDSKAVRAIQRAYPQIWFACHVEHRTRHGADGLTDRDAGILAHLDAQPSQRASELARHLGIGRPALSAQLKRLLSLGLIVQEPGKDARERLIRLTGAGEQAVSAKSPLDADRVAALLRGLTPQERKHAVAGLELLAQAARRLSLPKQP